MAKKKTKKVPRKKKFVAKKKTPVKRRKNGQWDYGNIEGIRFKLGNKASPGRPKDWTAYAQQEISQMEGLDPKSDEYLRVMAQLQWMYAKAGRYEALRDSLERQFGKIPDMTIIVQKIQVDVIHRIGAMLPQAMLQAGVPKKQVNEALTNFNRLLEAGE